MCKPARPRLEAKPSFLLNPPPQTVYCLYKVCKKILSYSTGCSSGLGKLQITVANVKHFWAGSNRGVGADQKGREKQNTLSEHPSPPSVDKRAGELEGLLSFLPHKLAGEVKWSQRKTLPPPPAYQLVHSSLAGWDTSVWRISAAA